MFNTNNILNYFTFAFLGIEETIWNKIDSLEKQKFHRVTIFVLIISVIIIIGMYEFFYLLLNNMFIALILGILFSLVVINIFRFSIFTIQNPIYFEQDIETKVMVEQNTINTTEALNSTSNTLSTFVASTKNILFSVIRFFSFKLIIRVIINGILILFIVLPFTCFLYQKDINQINAEKRNQLISAYNNNCNTNFNKLSNALDLKIKKLKKKNELNQNIIYNTELKKELQLQKELLTEWNEKRQNDVLNYKKNIVDKNFIIYSYKFIGKQLGFWLVLIFLSSLFIISHVQKYLLLNPTNKYYGLANKYYYEIALKHYNHCESLIKETLQKKYNNKIHGTEIVDYYESLIGNSCYTDPPFNSKMKEYKIPLKKLTSIELINFFSTK
jgi:hypothetical protein